MCRRMMYFAVVVTSMALAGSASADLVGHWRLDDGAGTVASDSSGNGHDGELIGNPQWVEGVYGGALQFAGTPDKVDIPYSDQLNPEGEFSASVWANVDPGGSGHRSPITSRDDYPQRGYIIYCEPGNTWQFWTGSAAGGWNNTTGPAVDLGEWTHLAITYSNGEKKLYVNGELSGEGTDEMALNTAQVLRIGAGATEGAGNYFFVGTVDDVAVFDHAMTEAEVQGAMKGIAPAELAADPSPADTMSDISRDTVLVWEPGEFAATHDVYLGTIFDDVNDATRGDTRGVLVSENQSGTTYDPGRLEFGQTYYWRIDEVNAAPDNTIFKGNVWSFAVEPLAYPITNIIVTSNGVSETGVGPENTVNGSGLDGNDQHSIDSDDMWLARAPGAEPIQIEYAFDHVYKLHQMLVWNYNVQFEILLGFGIKDVTAEYSEDGMDWTVLGDVELAQATARMDYVYNTTIDFDGAPVKYVRLTVNSGFGTMGQYGLSEVRFLSIPVQAREPEPADVATDVSIDTVLAWRAGRGATSHEVYLGTGPEALPAVATVDAGTYTPGTLDLSTVYYWRIDEVNEAEAVTTWEGGLWSFTTQEFAVIDGFEAYDDEDNRIYDTWLDGWVNGSGATVGYFEEPFAEQTIVNSGRQSMPLTYNNAVTPFYSEASRIWAVAQNWTAGGADTLQLSFQGVADNSVEPLYVAVEDVAGNMAVVTHEDPNAVLATAWQAWSIPFETLSDAGVNLTQVETLSVGVGDRNNPVAGGTGLIYIDDVLIGRPLEE